MLMLMSCLLVLANVLAQPEEENPPGPSRPSNPFLTVNIDTFRFSAGDHVFLDGEEDLRSRAISAQSRESSLGRGREWSPSTVQQADSSLYLGRNAGIVPLLKDIMNKEGAIIVNNSGERLDLTEERRKEILDWLDRFEEIVGRGGRAYLNTRRLTDERERRSETPRHFSGDEENKEN